MGAASPAEWQSRAQPTIAATVTSHEPSTEIKGYDVANIYILLHSLAIKPGSLKQGE